MVAKEPQDSTNKLEKVTIILKNCKNLEKVKKSILKRPNILGGEYLLEKCSKMNPGLTSPPLYIKSWDTLGNLLSLMMVKG